MDESGDLLHAIGPGGLENESERFDWEDPLAIASALRYIKDSLTRRYSLSDIYSRWLDSEVNGRDGLEFLVDFRPAGIPQKKFEKALENFMDEKARRSAKAAA